MRSFLIFLAPVLMATNCDPVTTPTDDGGPPCAELWSEGHTPEQVDEWAWNGQVVLRADFGCCDMYTEVYDQDCTYLCAPDGGLTGLGDGTCPDFFDEARHLETIWVAE